MDFKGMENLENNFEHVAIGHSSRSELKDPIAVRGEEGFVFEIDNEYMMFSDDEEEVFDADILAELGETGRPSGLCNMPADKARRIPLIDERMKLFDTKIFERRSFADFEEEMTLLVEDGSVRKLVLREGNGVEVTDRSKIYYHYCTMYEGASEAYDTSFLRDYPNVTDLRQDDLLPGVSIAVRSMRVREVSRFFVEPSMAYGKVGCAPRIPGNAKLLYVIEMIHCIDEASLSTLKYMTTDERAALPFSQILEEGHKFRGDGNFLYRDGNYRRAVRIYRSGINILESYPVVGDEDSGRRDELLWMLYCNMAQCYIKSDKPAQACNACKNGLKSATDGKSQAKLLYRFAQAQLMLGSAERALQITNQALRHDPGFPEIIELKEKCRKEISKQNKIHKRICQRMFQSGNQKSSSGDSIGAVKGSSISSAASGTSEEEVSERIDVSKKVSSSLACTSGEFLEQETQAFFEGGMEERQIDWDEELVEPFMYCSDEIRKELMKTCKD